MMIEGAAPPLAPCGAAPVEPTIEAALPELRRTAAEATLVAERTSKAQRMAATTGDELRFLAAVMRKIMPAIEMIDRSMRQAGPMAQMLENVAATAHLLALNAELQAERAGEAGPILVVMAEELRALARQSARAGQAIPELVEAVSQDVGLGTALIAAANDALHGMSQQFQALSTQLDIAARSAGGHAGTLREAMESGKRDMINDQPHLKSV